jgi:hypothetical protein
MHALKLAQRITIIIAVIKAFHSVHTCFDLNGNITRIHLSEAIATNNHALQHIAVH